MRTKQWYSVAALAILLALQSASFSAEKLMLKGHDPVAYFTNGKPTMGLKQFAYTWSGGTYHFASKENLELFKKNPEKYASQYGSNCAYAVSQGYTAPVDPEAWEIVNDKLYLNYSKSVREKWRAKREAYIISADKNWPAIRAKEQKDKQ